MKKCLRISFTADLPAGYLQDFFQVQAKKLNLEGAAHGASSDGVVTLVVCGEKDNIDQFVDLLHKESSKIHFDDLSIEPFLKDKDYRGVFRIIE